MPFTPLHVGPGLLVKSVLNTSFSLMIFGWAQILMDIQPLVVLITGEGHLLGFSHTFIGASLIALGSAVTGKYGIEWAVHAPLLGFSDDNRAMFDWNRKLRWGIVLFSAFVGTFSHVYLDAIMHSDVQPFFPVDVSNPILGVISVSALQKLCMYTGVVGMCLYVIVRFFRRVD
jgi:hypothetical protein